MAMKRGDMRSGLADTKYRLYHTAQEGYLQPFPQTAIFIVEKPFKPYYVIIFGAGNSNVLSIKTNNQEQLVVSSIPAIFFQPSDTTIHMVETWCKHETLGQMMSLKRNPGLTLPPVNTAERLVVELSDKVDCICIGGRELI